MTLWEAVKHAYRLWRSNSVYVPHEDLLRRIDGLKDEQDVISQKMVEVMTKAHAQGTGVWFE